MGEYGLDIFANAIMRYAHERGQRMRKRAVRDGRRLDHETFLSYGELQIPSNPDDYLSLIHILRKYGSARHAGFGLGFERCVMYLTGMSNIRDVIPFPRTVNNCEL